MGRGVFPNHPPPQIDKTVTMQHIRIMRYAIVIEKTATGFSAFVPDLPGCIPTGRDPAEVKGEMKSAIWFHIDGMIEGGLPMPKPTSIAEYVED